MKIALPAVLIAAAMATASTTASASYCPSGNKYKKHAHHYYPEHYRHYGDMHAYYPRYPQPYWHADRPAYKQPSEQDPARDAAASAPTQASVNIIETATSAGSFNTLLDALDTAGLVETLQGTGPFTVFAPSDEAFAKIPDSIRTAIIADKDALTELLTYHVIAGEVTAADVASLTSAETAQGSTITIDTSDGVKVDGARVVTTDIRASNGIIHVIDTVMIPN
jgi:uncharacterized surface protein with fasciclin (FAS1) repeats